MSKAKDIAEGFDGDPKGLPKKVQEAIAEVEKLSVGRAQLVEAMRVRGDYNDAEYEYEKAGCYAYRYEEIDGEIIEVRKDSPNAQVKIIHRPDLVPPGKLSPVEISPHSVLDPK